MAHSVQNVKSAGPGRHDDRVGLFLYVKPTGARSWVLRYQMQGWRMDLGLGAYPGVTLAMARDRAAEARRLIAGGQDPIAEKQQAKPKTFKQAALELVERKRPGWKSTKHAAQWTATFGTYVFPKIGPMQVGHVETADVIAVLTPIWANKPETASRVRQRIEVVLDDPTAPGNRKPERERRHHRGLPRL